VKRPLALVLAAAAGACVLWACSVGQGVGEVTGEVHIPDCGVERTDYSMDPDFFAAEFTEDLRTREPGGVQRMVTLRLQRGSYRERDSDGLLILLRDVNEIQTSLLDTPIEIGNDLDAMVQMTVYLSRTCDSGFPREFWTVPGVLQAVEGTLTLSSVHSPGAPDADGENIGEFRGAFDGVRFEDVNEPDTRFAILSGSFAFFYQRGRPAQHF
jgi:hypothetical protein